MCRLPCWRVCLHLCYLQGGSEAYFKEGLPFASLAITLVRGLTPRAVSGRRYHP